MKNESSRINKKAGRPKNPVSKETLLAIASELFAKQGYHKTTLDDIADRAGIHRTSLLHHVKSKKAFYGEILDGILAILREHIATARQRSGDFVEALDRLGNEILTYFGTHPEAAQLLLRELMDGGPYFSGDNGRVVIETLDVTEGFLTAGMTAGAFKTQDARQLTLSVSGVHVCYFLAESFTRGFLGPAAYSPVGIERRRQAMLEHVRALCLKPRD